MYFVRFVLFCADAVNEFLNRNCPYIAGAVAFYTLFSMFPLLLATISILGFLLGPQAKQTELALQITSMIPVSAEFVGETIEGVVSARAITGVASVVGLLWAATAAFGAIRKGINAAWGIKRTRPFLKERLIDFGLVLGAGVVMLSVLFSGPVLGTLTEVSRIVAPEAYFATDLVWNLLRRLVAPGVSFLTFLVLYRFLPNTRVGIKDVWIGALLASAAFQGANWGFVLYLSRVPVYNLVYGSVGAILVLLTWVYVSAIIVLFGALVTSRYAACAASRGGEDRGPKILWQGLSRVRLRVVAEPTTAG